MQDLSFERRRGHDGPRSACGLSKFLLAALLVFPAVDSIAAACIWFADANSIKQVNTDDNTVVAAAALGDPRRLVMNDNDCNVWALSRTDRRLIRFDPGGNQISDIDLTAFDATLLSPERIRLDPFDNSLWVTSDNRIFHFDSGATQLLGSIVVPADIRRFRIGMDQKLWVLGKRKLWRFNRNGKLLEERLLDPVLRGEARQFVVDELRAAIWIAGDQQIAKLDAVGSGTPTLVFDVPGVITAFALDPVTGRVWYGQSAGLTALNPDGTLFVDVDLAASGLSGLNRLAFDPASDNLWAGFPQQLARFTDSGDLVAVLPAEDYDDEALGVPPFIVKPRIAINQPPENGLVNKPKPPIKLEYKARCNGHSCDVPNGYLSTFQLTATLNGTAIGPQFVFNADTTIATFQPATRLPEGVSSFSARATDVFGHKSNPIDTTFTVDTISPKFLTIAPAEGSTFAMPNVTIQGTIDDPTATVVLSGLGISQTGTTFSFPVVLQPGLNTFNLSATDHAGNVVTATRHLTSTGTANVAVAVATPAAGATINSDTVAVLGTFLGPSNTGITVNGVVAAIIGNTFVAPSVPLRLGANTLTVTLTAPNNQTASQTFSVVSTGPAPIQVAASPPQGVAPLGVTFAVINRTTNTIQSIRADYAGTGNSIKVAPGAPIFNTYPAPGIYQASFVITDNTGATYPQTIFIVVQDITQIDGMLRTAWGGFTAALAARDTTQALQYFNSRAQLKYGPVLSALQLNMPQIVASFSAPQPASISPALGEYVVGRTINGVRQVYFIYFLRDVDGVWRLDSM